MSIYQFRGYMGILMSSIIAGILIALGGCANVIVGGPIGALLFAFGLVCVIKMGVLLFTGIAGKLDMYQPSALLVCWIGNFIGAALIGGFYRLGEFSAANPYVVPKVGIALFIRALLCGLVINICVTKSKEESALNGILGAASVVLGVALFILCGFAHSIANMFYMVAFEFDPFALIVITVGNFVGCNIVPAFAQIKKAMDI